MAIKKSPVLPLSRMKTKDLEFIFLSEYDADSNIGVFLTYKLGISIQLNVCLDPAFSFYFPQYKAVKSSLPSQRKCDVCHKKKLVLVLSVLAFTEITCLHHKNTHSIYTIANI
jgi:hypothetical protein